MRLLRLALASCLVSGLITIAVITPAAAALTCVFEGTAYVATINGSGVITGR